MVTEAIVTNRLTNFQEAYPFLLNSAKTTHNFSHKSKAYEGGTSTHQDNSTQVVNVVKDLDFLMGNSLSLSIHCREAALCRL